MDFIWFCMFFVCLVVFFNWKSLVLHTYKKKKNQPQAHSYSVFLSWPSRMNYPPRKRMRAPTPLPVAPSLRTQARSVSTSPTSRSGSGKLTSGNCSEWVPHAPRPRPFSFLFLFYILPSLWWLFKETTHWLYIMGHLQ